MKRILIIGRGSAGKSTFAIALGKKLNLPVIHLDQYFLKDNWELVEEDAKHKIHTELITKSEWIIEGSSEFLEERAKRAEAFIVFDVSPHKTIPSWLHRMWKYRGTTRPDVSGHNVEKFNLAYMKWQLKLRSTQKKIELLKSVAPEKELIIFNNRSQAQRYLEGL